MFDETKIRNWVQNGIDQGTVDAAYLWAWCFVCPNHSVKALTDKIKREKREQGRYITDFEKPFKDLSVRERDEVVNDNKSDALTTSQIRTVFGELRRIQSNGLNSKVGDSSQKDEKTSFIMLRPKLAYAVKRHNKKGLSNFYDFFLKAHGAVDLNSSDKGEAHFRNFMSLLEAVLAYHKFHGGKE